MTLSTKWIWGGTAIAVVLGIVFIARATSSKEKSEEKKSPASTAIVADGFIVRDTVISDNVQTVGSLVANEEINVVSEVARRIVKVHFKEGAFVQKGQLLFKLDDADIAAALEKLTLQRNLAANIEARQQKLRKQNLLSEQEYDAALNSLRTLDADIKLRQVDLSRTTIRAPFAGKIGLRRISQGALVSPAATLTTLQDVSRIKLDFTLPEKYAGEVSVGKKISFTTESGAGKLAAIDATVIATEPKIDAGTRSLVVRAIADNRAGDLVPGAFATVSLSLRETAHGILVPSQAIIPDIRGYIVYTLTDGKATAAPVKIGLRTSERVQILDGVKAGDTVLTTGVLRLKPGLEVKLKSIE